MEDRALQERGAGVFDLFYRILHLVNTEDEHCPLLPGVGIGIFDIDPRVTEDLCNLVQPARAGPSS